MISKFRIKHMVIITQVTFYVWKHGKFSNNQLPDLDPVTTTFIPYFRRNRLFLPGPFGRRIRKNDGRNRVQIWLEYFPLYHFEQKQTFDMNKRKN